MAAERGSEVDGDEPLDTDSDAVADTAQVDELSARLRDAEDRYIRLRADFENLKRRTAQERLDARRNVTGEIADRLLPVLDDAERVTAHLPEEADERWLRGVELTVQKLRDALASMGVTPIEAVGTRFDPALHEAIGSEESSDVPEGAVTSELRRGYRIDDRVLRPSLVRLARRPAER